MTLFDGGLIGSQVDQAEATYDQTVATYRQTVLDGFREVEDYLVQLGVLDEERGAARSPGVGPRGTAPGREPVQEPAPSTTPTWSVRPGTALSNERTVLTLLGSRLTASVS